MFRRFSVRKRLRAWNLWASAVLAQKQKDDSTRNHRLVYALSLIFHNHAKKSFVRRAFVWWARVDAMTQLDLAAKEDSNRKISVLMRIVGKTTEPLRRAWHRWWNCLKLMRSCHQHDKVVVFILTRMQEDQRRRVLRCSFSVLSRHARLSSVVAMERQGKCLRFMCCPAASAIDRAATKRLQAYLNRWKVFNTMVACRNSSRLQRDRFTLWFRVHDTVQRLAKCQVLESFRTWAMHTVHRNTHRRLKLPLCFPIIRRFFECRTKLYFRFRCLDLCSCTMP
jgi:hypothetical protein